MLLQAIEETAQEMHCEQLVLHTASDNYGALRLFEADGFRLKRSKSRFYPQGQDALEMMKKLPCKGGIKKPGNKAIPRGPYGND
jgi:ribosomal protein S18 acetylase RimI-like enzyme